MRRALPFWIALLLLPTSLAAREPSDEIDELVGPPGGLAVVIAISYLGTIYDVRHKLLPKQRELESLIAKLAEAEEPTV